MALGPDAEPVQPVPSRYWLADSGPAPLGNRQLSVHLDPQATLLAGGAASLTVAVSSDRLDVATAVTVTVTAPAGFTAEPADRVLEIGADGWTTFEVVLTAAGDAPAGAHLVEIEAVVGGEHAHDTALVWVGEPGGRTAAGFRRADAARERAGRRPGDRRWSR